MFGSDVRRTIPGRKGLGTVPRRPRLCDGDVVVEVDILDGVQNFNAVLHRLLERLAAGDESHAACALVDDSCANHLFQ